jgi:hypothetical protein
MTKTSAFTALAGGLLVPADLVDVVDISDTSMAASGTNKKMTADDFAWSVGAFPMRYKTADQSNSSNTTLADVTDLSWSIVANGIYAFEFCIMAVAAATTTGLVLSVNGPASPDHLRYFMESPTSSTATFHAGATAYDTALVSTAVISTTLPTRVQLQGFLDNGANAGTFALRMRSEVSGSNATIQRGSWGRLIRLA